MNTMTTQPIDKTTLEILSGVADLASDRDQWIRIAIGLNSALLTIKELVEHDFDWPESLDALQRAVTLKELDHLESQREAERDLTFTYDKIFKEF
jgi:hypothetical protein